MVSCGVEKPHLERKKQMARWWNLLFRSPSFGAQDVQQSQLTSNIYFIFTIIVVMMFDSHVPVCRSMLTISHNEQDKNNKGPKARQDLMWCYLIGRINMTPKEQEVNHAWCRRMPADCVNIALASLISRKKRIEAQVRELKKRSQFWVGSIKCYFVLCFKLLLTFEKLSAHANAVRWYVVSQIHS